MSATEHFFDTNVLLYLLSDDDRADAAAALVATGGVISVQVLNEFAAVATRKLRMSVAEVSAFLADLRRLLKVVPMTVSMHERALNIARRYKFGIYDSLIVGAAMEAGCTILYSEDLQHRQHIAGRLTVLNPFAQPSRLIKPRVRRKQVKPVPD